MMPRKRCSAKDADLISAMGLVIIGAFVLVRVTVLGAICASATAMEAKQANFFLARHAARRCHLLRSWLSSLLLPSSTPFSACLCGGCVLAVCCCSLGFFLSRSATIITWICLTPLQDTRCRNQCGRAGGMFRCGSSLPLSGNSSSHMVFLFFLQGPSLELFLPVRLFEANRAEKHQL
jgi:hypothetical protein